MKILRRKEAKETEITNSLPDSKGQILEFLAKVEARNNPLIAISVVKGNVDGSEVRYFVKFSISHKDGSISAIDVSHPIYEWQTLDDHFVDNAVDLFLRDKKWS